MALQTEEMFIDIIKLFDCERSKASIRAALKTIAFDVMATMSDYENI